MKLRAYQQAAIDGLYDYWSENRGDNPLIVAPTGSGKSLIIAQVVMDAIEFPDTRVMILTHVKELLEQNAAELIALKPSLEPDIGFYSAGLNRKQIDELITFAGIQSIWQLVNDMHNVPDLVIIDEAHLVPKKTATRYNSFIADLRNRNPMVKIIGLTATPYRLDSGYLHHGDGAIFDGIAYDIDVASLMEDGWLAPVISKAGIKSIDLSDVGMRGGEFIESELAIAASDPDLIRMSVNEVVELGSDRRCWLVFCSGVNHAQLVAREFLTYHDIECAVVTGTDSNEDRADKIERFKSGEIKCLINVNVLTTGFNAPAVDLVALMRATCSPGLYVQMVGRGTRTAPGKDDCLILDYGENVMRHGFIDKIKPRKPGTGKGEAPAKKCPECEHMMPTAVLVCPYCEYQFPPPEIKHAPEAYDGAMLSSQVVAEWLDVFMVAYARHRKKDKLDSIKITYTTDSMLAVSEWLCPDHGGYATDKYRQRMSVLGAVALTTEDALTDCETWKTPSRIKVKPDGNFFKIVQFDYSQRDNDPDPEWLEYAHLLQ